MKDVFWDNVPGLWYIYDVFWEQKLTDILLDFTSSSVYVVSFLQFGEKFGLWEDLMQEIISS